MNKKEIASKLEAEGYEVLNGKYEYWESIPYVLHADGLWTYIAKTYNKMGSAGVELDLNYKKVLQAIETKSIDINQLEGVLDTRRIKKEVEEIINNQ